VVDALLHRRSPCPVDWVSRHPTRIPAWEGAHAHGYEALPQLMAGADLLVNATTVGMAGGPKSFPSPVAVEALAGRAAVIDIVYPRPPGGLLEAAQRVGARVQDGLPMLLWQGVRALEAWLGGPVSKPAIEAMRRALDESLLK
jgi:shikimate dehydrogenase